MNLSRRPALNHRRVIGLADDIARSMSAISARVAVVQGRNAMGIELPNSNREIVSLRELLESETWNGIRQSYHSHSARISAADLPLPTSRACRIS